jgi:hypothetical protein
MRCNDLRKKMTQCKNRHYRPYIRGLRAVTGYEATGRYGVPQTLTGQREET